MEPSSILLIDDNAGVRRSVAALLRSAGHDVRTARDGVDGVESFRRHHQELGAVILDVSMPGLGGDEALRIMAGIDATVPVVLTTGQSAARAVTPDTARLIAGILEKPFLAGQLFAALAAALASPGKRLASPADPDAQDPGQVGSEE